ncbi:MAG: outer membrane beta-barrel protein [Gammaproteobacteria bacterium]|nr:outer membrane beta-barrel protein [Gammaproteobacteria bacterium]
MRKRTTYLLTMLALTSSTAAYAANGGFYIGLDAGRQTGAVKQDDKAAGSQLIFDSQLEGFLWGAHAGYNFFLSKQFVLGSELFWNHSGAKFNRLSTDSEGTIKLQITDSVGASILPGWQLDSNNRVYARLGWIQSQLTQDSNTPLVSMGPSFQGARVNGIELGVGYLVALVNQWDLRMEYDHDSYNTLHQYVGAGSYSYNPDLDRYTLGVNYNFDPTQIKFADQIQLSASGWYAGVDAGRDNASLKSDSVTINDSPNTTLQEKMSLRGYLGGLHLGYQWQLMPKIVLGVEGFTSLSSTMSDTTVVSGSHYVVQKLREEYSFGASLLPGYQLNQANLLYTRIGYIATKFSSTEQVAQGTISDAPEFSTTKPGLQLGLGYAVALTNKFSVFGEYDYARYGAISAASSIESYTYHPTDNLYKIGINDRF